MSKRHTRITIQSEEVVVARRIASPVIAWCPKCATETGMVSLTQAALLRHVDRRTIQEWMQSGELHVLETAEIGPLICVTSLNRRP